MKPMIQYADFAKLEIRIGKVVEAVVPEGSKKLIRQRVDFGEGIGERIIFSGIKEWYSPEDMVGKYLPYVINLEPRKMPSFAKASDGKPLTTKASDGKPLTTKASDGKPLTAKASSPAKALEDKSEGEPEESQGMLLAVAPVDLEGKYACVLLEPSGRVQAGDEVI